MSRSDLRWVRTPGPLPAAPRCGPGWWGRGIGLSCALLLLVAHLVNMHLPSVIGCDIRDVPVSMFARTHQYAVGALLADAAPARMLLEYAFIGDEHSGTQGHVL